MVRMVKLMIFAAVAFINILGFILMGYDKRKSRLKGWRIPEIRFFLIAAIGGALGIFLGMKVFHHKTKHFYFVYGIPLLIILNLVIYYVLFKKVY